LVCDRVVTKKTPGECRTRVEVRRTARRGLAAGLDLEDRT